MNKSCMGCSYLARNDCGKIIYVSATAGAGYYKKVTDERCWQGRCYKPITGQAAAQG